MCDPSMQMTLAGGIFTLFMTSPCLTLMVIGFPSDRLRAFLLNMFQSVPSALNLFDVSLMK